MGSDFFVNRLHPLLGQRAGVLQPLFADLAETRDIGGIVLVRRIGVEHAARAELGLELRILRVVHALRLLFRVQVVEVAEPLIEPVDRGQHVVAVAEVVLAELARHVAQRLQQFGQSRIGLREPFRRAGQADLGEAGADGRLPGDECRAAGGAALLAVPVGEQRALLGDAVDVRRLVAHLAHVVGADVELADVVAPDDEDVGLLGLGVGVRHTQERQPQGQREDRVLAHSFSLLGVSTVVTLLSASRSLRPANGFARYATAPRRSARARVAGSSCAVMKMTGRSPVDERTFS